MFVAPHCRTGAIQVHRPRRGASEPLPLVNRVTVRESGALAVHAQIEIDGETAGANAVRCSTSANKPDSDGRHVGADFFAAAPARRTSRNVVEHVGASASLRPAGPL